MTKRAPDYPYAPILGPDSRAKMTAGELTAIMDKMRWGNAAMADMLNCSESYIRSMRLDKTNRFARPIADYVAFWLRRVVDIMDKYPPPARESLKSPWHETGDNA